MTSLNISKDEEDSDAYKIFNLPWLCAIPEIYMRSPIVVAEEGTMTTGDKQYDDEIQRSSRTLYRTIAAMIVYFEEGANIRILNNEDIPKIYKILENHLKNWEWIVTHQPFTSHPPLEDFFLMEDFLIQLKPLKDAKEITLKNEPIMSNTIFGMHGALLRASLLPRKMQQEKEKGGNVNIAAINSIAERIARIALRSYSQ